MLFFQLLIFHQAVFLQIGQGDGHLFQIENLRPSFIARPFPLKPGLNVDNQIDPLAGLFCIPIGTGYGGTQFLLEGQRPFSVSIQLISRSLALYVISVRRARDLLTASFRFYLTIDTLAVQLYTSHYLGVFGTCTR